MVTTQNIMSYNISRMFFAHLIHQQIIVIQGSANKNAHHRLKFFESVVKRNLSVITINFAVNASSLQFILLVGLLHTLSTVIHTSNVI